MCATAVLTLGLVFGPFLLHSRGVLLYDIFGFHTDRMQPAMQLRAMRRSLVGFVEDFPIPVLLGCAGLAIWARKIYLAPDRRSRMAASLPRVDDRAGHPSLIAAHLIPRTTDSYYNSLQMPLLNVLGALVLTWIWHSLAGRPALRWAGAILLAAMILLNGIQQGSALVSQIWSPSRRETKSSLSRMQPPSSSRPPRLKAKSSLLIPTWAWSQAAASPLASKCHSSGTSRPGQPIKHAGIGSSTTNYCWRPFAETWGSGFHRV